MTDVSPPSFDILLDTQGLYCPEPVMMLHGAIADLGEAQTIKVIATDPSTQRDIPKFCDFLGYSLIYQIEGQNTFEFFIRK